MVVVCPGSPLRKLVLLYALRGRQVLTPKLEMGAGMGTNFGLCFPDSSPFVRPCRTGGVRQVDFRSLKACWMPPACVLRWWCPHCLVCVRRVAHSCLQYEILTFFK